MRGTARDEAFTAFVDAHQCGLMRAAFLLVGDRAGAEDLLQESLLTVYRTWDSIREPAAALGYARTCMTRQFIDWARLHRTSRERVVAAVPEPGTAASSDSELARADARDQAFRLLARLSERERTAEVARHYLGMSERETAEAMGCSEGTVKSHTSRALGKLRVHPTHEGSLR